MFESIAQLLSEADRQKRLLHDVIIDDEVEYMGTSRDAVLARMRRSLDVMKRSLVKGLETDPVLPIKEAMHMAVKMAAPAVFLGKDMKEAARWAMEIAEHNSGMGLIVAAPTAGSSGVLPAALFKAKELLGKDDEAVFHAMFVAAAVGAIIGNRATLSGSEAGCQAEVGVASAMAAAGIAYMAGGNSSQLDNAIAITLTNIMGLICDPIAGLVISPCIKRNAMGVLNAFLGAEMALSGVNSIVPADEVIDAMMKVGKKLPPELKETGLGGIADTPTGRRIKQDIFKDASGK
ncbi:MAG: L-serine ammonia-lyase, iron-sulfur-dependent, subunit alpha [Candidatus Sigynarchaeota archaeon]